VDAAPAFATVRLADAVTVTAPDGSVVRVLAGLPQASMGHFTLAAGAVSVAVRHRTVSELWYIEVGRGQMWLRAADGDAAEEVVDLSPGVSLSIPVGTAFQFQATDREEDLAAGGVTIPPWPGDGEAVTCHGPWPPSVEPGPGLAVDPQPSSPSQGPATAL
jgi:mannose-6-phosphate isomerase-like protein (cupin superfamily)